MASPTMHLHVIKLLRRRSWYPHSSTSSSMVRIFFSPPQSPPPQCIVEFLQSFLFWFFRIKNLFRRIRPRSWCQECGLSAHRLLIAKSLSFSSNHTPHPLSQKSCQMQKKTKTSKQDRCLLQPWTYRVCELFLVGLRIFDRLLFRRQFFNFPLC
jgi:hypothetical protein